jgi:hypothetical protein
MARVIISAYLTARTPSYAFKNTQKMESPNHSHAILTHVSLKTCWRVTFSHPLQLFIIIGYQSAFVQEVSSNVIRFVGCLHPSTPLYLYPPILCDGLYWVSQANTVASHYNELLGT